MKKPARKNHQIDRHSTLFQIGRLLFPDLINRSRAMRLRMTIISVVLGIAMAAAMTAFLLKANDLAGRELPVYARPLDKR